jgi:RNA recognition motif-containing protein
VARKICAGNLNYRVTREELLALARGIGPVVDVVMPQDKRTGRPRGFAFVEYETEGDAARAVTALDGRELAGRRLRVTKARPRSRRQQLPGPMEDELLFRSPFPAKTKGSRRGIRARKRGFYDY